MLKFEQACYVKYIEFIKETVAEILPEAEIYLFGSRTQNKAQKYSDVDIALKGEISFENLLKIKIAFENSTFPYKVDVVDLNSLKPEFLNIIKNDLHKIK